MINLKPVKGRECGTCTVCCTIPKITEFNKPVRTDCHHLRLKDNPLYVIGGCSIYNERPNCCRTFQCLWLQGHFGGDEDRPDKLGIMGTITYRDTIHFWEVWPGAASTQRARYWFHKMAQRIVFVIEYVTSPRTIMGKRGLVDKFCIKHGITRENTSH